MRNTLKGFIESEKTGGLILILCTFISILIANSTIGQHYLGLWHINLGGLSLELWINDGLMAIFFFLIGLELMEEVREGHLSNLRSALLPITAALGGMIVPALIYVGLNYNTSTINGFGIPMATDIAFALGVLSLLGSRVPTSLKIFLTAFAVIDDLGAIIVIAIFYTNSIAWGYLFVALGLFILLLLFNKVFNIKSIYPYLFIGVAMWFCMLHSGIHATIAGVLLAITIPYEKKTRKSPNHYLQKKLHYPVAFLVLPIFALANTAIIIEPGWDKALNNPYALGIVLGLVIGKPVGIMLFTYLSTLFKLYTLPKGIRWSDVFGASLLGGIGFTMSIFITLLAFSDSPHIMNEAKLAILLASFAMGILGYICLNITLKKKRV